MSIVTNIDKMIFYDNKNCMFKYVHIYEQYRLLQIVQQVRNSFYLSYQVNLNLLFSALVSHILNIN